MADDKYSLKNTAINDGWMAFGGVSPIAAMPSQVMGGSATDLVSSLGQMLAMVGLKISLLTTALESLTLSFSSQRSLLRASSKAGLASEQNSVGETVGSLEPPKLFTSGKVNNASMAEPGRDGQFSERRAPSTPRVAGVPLIAAAGTTVLDLPGVEYLPSRAAVDSGQPEVSDRKVERLDIVREVTVNTSALTPPTMSDTEKMPEWRAPLKFDGAQIVDQSQVINHPGNIAGEHHCNIHHTSGNPLPTTADNAQPPKAKNTVTSLNPLVGGLAELADAFPKITAALVVAAAVLEPLMEEMANQVAKRVLGRAAAHLPDAFGEVFSEDARAKSRATKADTSNTPPRPKPRKGPTVRVSTRGSRGTSRLTAMTSSMRSMTRRAPGPLKVVGAAVDVVEGALSGNARMVGAGLGAAGGGWAGATAGSAAGAVLGSVVPVIGTAIGGVLGGLIGGWLGSESGAFLGEKLAAPAADRLASPEQVNKELTSANTQNQQINYSPSIQVTCTGADSSEHIRMIVAQQLQTQFHGEFVPLMTTNALAIRSDAALTDGGT